MSTRASKGLAPLVAALAMAALAALASRAHANCGAEGCPLSSMGPETAFGRWGFDLGYESVEQDQLWDGTHRISAEDLEHEEGGDPDHLPTIENLTRSRTWRLNARYRFSDRLFVAGTIPYTERVHRHTVEHHTDFFVPYTWNYQGLADASVVAHMSLTGARPGDRHGLGVIAGLKLPTGDRHLEEQGGEAPEPPVRLGSGSTDALVGLSYRYGVSVARLDGGRGTLPLQLSTTSRLNTRGTDDYRMGNEFQVNATSAYPLAHWADALLQLNLATHGADRVGETDAEPHHTGGTSVFATPGLRVAFGGGFAAYGYAQLPLYRKTSGPQLVAPAHFIFGTSFTLGR